MDLEKLIRKNIKSLKPYSSARDEFNDFNKKMVFIDANENPFGNKLNRYPDPQQIKVKNLLAKQKGINKSQILLGNGSDEVLDLIFRVFCEPKEDNIIILPPTYGMYKVLANLNNIELTEVLLTDDFEPNVKNILENANKNTKLLFLCSPNNPTGNSFSKENIENILNNFKGIVIIDEAYIDFSEEKSWLERLSEFPNLIITQTLSKAYGMAGVRLGICYSSKEIISVLKKIKPPYNISQLTQNKAVKGLSNYKNVKKEVTEILKERDKFIKKIKSVSFVEKTYPTNANFVLVKVDNATKRYKQLLEKGIVVRNRTSQPLCENTLRFTIGTKKEMKILINALNEISYE